jgi:hypothetical protein
MGRPPEEVGGAAGMHTTRRLERQAQAIEEASREAAQAEKLKIAEEAARLRRRQRRQLETERRRRWLMILAGVAGVAVVIMGAAVTRVFFVWQSRTIAARENHGTGNEDPLAYVPASANFVMAVDIAICAPQLRTKISNAIEQKICEQNFLSHCRQSTGMTAVELFSKAILAISDSQTPSITLIGLTKKPLDQELVRKFASTQEFEGIFHGTPQKVKIPGGSFEAKARQHSGITFYTVDQPPFTTLLMPSDNIIVLTNARDEEVLQIVGSGGDHIGLSPAMLTQLNPIRNEPIWFVLGFNEKETEALKGRLSAGRMEPQTAVQTIIESLGQIRTVCATTNSAASKIEVKATLASDIDCKRLCLGLTSVLQDGKTLYDRLVDAGILPPAKDKKSRSGISDLTVQLTKNVELRANGTRAECDPKVLSTAVFQLFDLLVDSFDPAAYTASPVAAANSPKN